MNLKYFVILSLILIISGFYSVSASTAVISIDDLNTEGEIINADIKINLSEKYGAGTISVDYNPSIIRISDVQSSDRSEVMAWDADNTSGMVNFSAWNLTGTAGDFTLATMVFQPVGNGISQLDIVVEVLADNNYTDIPVNISNGSITVNMESSSSSDSSSGGSSGGGGGGGTSGEAFANILISETEREYVNKDSKVSYSFNSEGNIVQYINFTGLKSSGEIAAKVEILKHNSTLANKTPLDIVYNNLNIWVGNSGWANSGNIANPTVKFIVETSWVSDNNIDSTSIRLNRYSDGDWNSLTTALTGEDALYLYYEAQTPGFSPFAITGREVTTSSSIVSEESTTESNSSEVVIDQTPDRTHPIEKQPGFGLFTGISLVLIAVQILRNKKGK
jgi:PGF-pre-PGF domain-containing protein